MAKSNSTNENTKVKSVELFITETLLKGVNVIIPDIGHLELTSFGERRTVLFKPNINNSDSFLQVMSPTSEKEQKDIYNLVSIPLKEGITVNLPAVGVFRPIKREDDKINVSFTLSSSLRSLLNKNPGEKVEELKEVKSETNEIKTLSAPTPSIREHNDALKTIPADIIKSSTDSGIKSDSRVPMNSGITPKQNSNLTDTQKSTFTSSVLQSDDKPEKRRSRMSAGGVLLLAVAAVFLLIILISSFYSHREERRGEPEMVTLPNDLVNLPALAEQHYGHSAFWIYIYEANRDKLSSPVNIPKGTSLVIPDLKTEYDVDVNDSMEIRRANIRAEIVLKERNNTNNIKSSITTPVISAPPVTTNSVNSDSDNIINEKK